MLKHVSMRVFVFFLLLANPMKRPNSESVQPKYYNTTLTHTVALADKALTRPPITHFEQYLQNKIFTRPDKNSLQVYSEMILLNDTGWKSGTKCENLTFWPQGAVKLSTQYVHAANRYFFPLQIYHYNRLNTENIFTQSLFVKRKQGMFMDFV